MTQRIEQCEVLIIGAGPAGSVAAAMLRQRGREVLVLERETFPRFSIGESLLPQSMALLEEAGLLRTVVEAGFQYKNGAAFVRGTERAEFDFREKHSVGWGTTYQVQRARFDHLLALEVERQGADVRYGHEVTAVDVSGESPTVDVRSSSGDVFTVRARKLLDASGFGRVLPRLLKLERPSSFPVRGAIFTHISDGTAPGDFDRNKIRVIVHPEHVDVWYWLIPFSDGRASVGVVAQRDFLELYQGNETERLQQIFAEDPSSKQLLRNAIWDTPARQIVGYASNVSTLHGKGFALLGNAGEFLDPVFSSGVTIAFRSANLACGCIEREFSGASVDWEAEFAKPLKKGVDTFRAFVESWYRGGFQRVIFHPNADPQISRYISAILAGYAWDETNPYVKDTERRLTALENACS